MLYVGISPSNIIDGIGLDIHHFSRTVTENKELNIYQFTRKASPNAGGDIRAVTA